MTLYIVHHFESEFGISSLEEHTPFHSYDEAVEYYNRLWSMYKDRPSFKEKVGELCFSVGDYLDDHSVSVWFEEKNL